MTTKRSWTVRDDWAKNADWAVWLRHRVQPGALAALTGQDARALEAIALCWELYSLSDKAGRLAALGAVRALLPAMQPQCRYFARELIARSLSDLAAAQLWDLVSP